MEVIIKTFGGKHRIVNSRAYLANCLVALVRGRVSLGFVFS